MVTRLERIENTIEAMDEMYDANFGEWIRNEENCKIVGANLKRYMGRYRDSDFITVVKWIMKDWTLKSIIFFTRRLVGEDLLSGDADQRTKYVRIITGFIYTWNPIFIAEFLMAITAGYPMKARAQIYVDVLVVFDARKLSEILTQIENKADDLFKSILIAQFNDNTQVEDGDGWSRSESLLKAYSLI